MTMAGSRGANMERPALQRLLADIRAGRIDIVVVYKADRLTRSLADFARLVEIFDAENVSLVSVTQQFDTTSSRGRLTLNVLLSFAQFEREVTGERISDKIAASKKNEETKLVLPGLVQQKHSSRCDPALIKAIAVGRVWFEELATGRARSLQDLAKRDGITRRYIAVSLVSPS
jgi:site-specific DNA recombinase